MENPKKAYLMTAPRIDDVCAFNRKRTAIGDSLDVVRLYFTPESLPQDVECEDISAVERYHDSRGNFKFPSATAMVADEHGLLEEPGVPELLEMLADNNGVGPGKHAGGWLKKLDWAFADVMADCPHLHHSVSMDDHLREWTARFDKIVDVYFRVNAEVVADGQTVFTGRHEAIFRDHFPEIYGELGRYLNTSYMRQPESLLTLPGYLVGLAVLMNEDDWTNGGVDRINQEFSFWKDAFRRKANVHINAKERAKQLQRALADRSGPHRFFETTVGTAVYVETDNKLIARYLWPLLKKSVVAMVIRERVRGDEDPSQPGLAGGKIAVQTRHGSDIDLMHLYIELSQLEPDAWYYEDRYGAPMLLNASAKIRNRPRTNLKPAEFIKIAAAHIRRAEPLPTVSA